MKKVLVFPVRAGSPVQKAQNRQTHIWIKSIDVDFPSWKRKPSCIATSMTPATDQRHPVETAHRLTVPKYAYILLSTKSFVHNFNSAGVKEHLSSVQ